MLFAIQRTGIGIQYELLGRTLGPDPVNEKKT